MPVHPLLSDAAWLRRRYLDDGATVAEIAAEADAHVSTVHLWLARHEIPARRYEVDRAAVERLLERRRTVPEIADALGVAADVIRDRLITWGLHAPASAVEYDLHEIRAWYEARGWSRQRIADELGVSARTAGRLLRAAGAELRRPGRRAGR